MRCSGPWHVHAVFHDHPRGKTFLSLLTAIAHGRPGPFCTPFLARLCQCSVAGLLCFVHNARQDKTCSRPHYIQTLSPNQLQPVTSACVPARPACAFILECAWTLRFSPLLLFTFHKAVSTCLLQVFLTMHTSRRARSTPTCDRQRLRQRIDRSEI